MRGVWWIAGAIAFFFLASAVTACARSNSDVETADSQSGEQEFGFPFTAGRYRDSLWVGWSANSPQAAFWALSPSSREGPGRAQSLHVISITGGRPRRCDADMTRIDKRSSGLGAFWLPTGKLLVTTTDGIAIADVCSGEVSPLISETEGASKIMLLGTDGQDRALIANEGILSILRISKGTVQSSGINYLPDVTRWAWDKKGEYLVVSTPVGTGDLQKLQLWLFDTSTGESKVIHHYTGDDALGVPDDLAWIEDDTILVTRTANGGPFLIDISGRVVLDDLRLPFHEPNEQATARVGPALHSMFISSNRVDGWAGILDIQHLDTASKLRQWCDLRAISHTSGRGFCTRYEGIDDRPWRLMAIDGNANTNEGFITNTVLHSAVDPMPVVDASGAYLALIESPNTLASVSIDTPGQIDDTTRVDGGIGLLLGVSDGAEYAAIVTDADDPVIQIVPMRAGRQ